MCARVICVMLILVTQQRRYLRKIGIISKLFYYMQVLFKHHRMCDIILHAGFCETIGPGDLYPYTGCPKVHRTSLGRNVPLFCSDEYGKPGLIDVVVIVVVDDPLVATLRGARRSGRIPEASGGGAGFIVSRWLYPRDPCGA